MSTARRLLALGGLVLVAGRRRAAPLLDVISPLAWLVVGVAALAGLAGWLLAWQELIVLALTLFAALLVACAFLFGRASFGVVVELSPRRVVAGERALGRIVVNNTGQRRSSPSRLELPVGRGVAEFMVPSLEPRAEHEELFAVPTQRRAVIVAGPAVSVRGDQLGLLRRTLHWTERLELFVHPVTVRLAPSAAGLVHDLEGEVSTTLTSNDIAFHALRSYEPGDDRRYVHWRTSARTGQLMVRQFEETRRSQLTILHSCNRDHYVSDDEFELAVSITASLAGQVIREGSRLSVVSEAHTLRTHTLTTMLDDSCRLQQLASRYPSSRDFARETTKRLPAPSVVMLITGSRALTADFRAVRTLFGPDTQTIGFRAEHGARSRLSTVSGLSLATVGRLGDLASLVRRMR